MKNFGKKSYTRAIHRNIVIQIISSIVILGILFFGYILLSRIYRKQSIELLRQSVKKTAIECYSVEGFYPAQLSYLEEEYDLSYDHEKYFVFYDAFSSNIMPNIEVYEKK